MLASQALSALVALVDGRPVDASLLSQNKGPQQPKHDDDPSNHRTLYGRARERGCGAWERTWEAHCSLYCIMLSPWPSMQWKNGHHLLISGLSSMAQHCSVARCEARIYEAAIHADCSCFLFTSTVLATHSVGPALFRWSVVPCVRLCYGSLQSVHQPASVQRFPIPTGSTAKTNHNAPCWHDIWLGPTHWALPKG